ncbi:hypothetical protein Nepgr_010044 [Nepenthes gracilis]|uniref:Uncharacterized protein n=1 Tax=Nepenthes gracilis TaxID=150966 RepID=A0AAD3XKX8_NEPGR|nr:hypothetical protein Nepgr_010044 [Nepenthes gracilis]
MKASLKFREDQKPLFRAKVPLNILGLPFQSGLAAGDSKELCLSLGTFFDSGPAFRVAYRPNDASNPFSLVLKTGIGRFGSPIDAPMTMSAEFNFVGRSNPTFSLHFRPQFGDFTIKKSQTSVFTHQKRDDAVSDDDDSIEVVERPLMDGHTSTSSSLKGYKMTKLPLRSTVGAAIDGALSGMELGARTVLPIRNGAVLKFRWGVKFPDDMKGLFTKEGLRNRTAAISSRGIPLLVMNKIGIEHVARNDPNGGSRVVGQGLYLPGYSDVAEACFAVKRQLETLQADNGRLREALEDLRSEFGSKRLSGSSCEERESAKHQSSKNDRRNWNERKSSEGSGFTGKEMESVNDELKKQTKDTGA